jgi:hypothetical protein
VCGVISKAAEECGSVECQQVINLKFLASQRVNGTKHRKTKLVRAISHDKKFNYRHEMLPVNSVPGYNLHMYQPVSTQGQPTILGQAISPTQIPLHIQTRQFLYSNLQPFIDNPIQSPNHYNRQCREISTTDDEKDEDITDNTNKPNWQIVSGTKRRKLTNSYRITTPQNHQ